MYLGMKQYVQGIHVETFLPRDATCRLSVRPSVCLNECLSVRDVQVPWSHTGRLEYFENNFAAK